MDLWSWLWELVFGPGRGLDPTRDWVADEPDRAPVLDLDQQTFAGVSLGHPPELLAWLGPCDHPDPSGESATWSQLGLYLELEAGRLCEIEVSFEDGAGVGGTGPS